MTKERIKEKLIPLKIRPTRPEHFAPLSEAIPSGDLDPEQRLIAKEEGVLEEPENIHQKSPKAEDKESDLPSGVTLIRPLEGLIRKKKVGGANIGGPVRPDILRDKYYGAHPADARRMNVGETHNEKSKRPKGEETIRKEPSQE